MDYKSDFDYRNMYNVNIKDVKVHYYCGNNKHL